ncbi:MAG: hypothetical protein ACHRHE_12850 [Tepidisphaerales bacterium]
MADIHASSAARPQIPGDVKPPAPLPAPGATDQDRAHLAQSLARLVLVTFVFTFVIARILVIFIMAGKLPPQLFFHVTGTHVHHLNYGIILLSLTGAYLIFARPSGKHLSMAALLYGIGLALTFDEFGMWLHLGGPYWQRASFDAVITVASALALLAYGSKLRTWRPHHRLTLIVLLAVLCLFGVLLHKSMKWAHHRLGPVLYHLEQRGPS